MNKQRYRMKVRLISFLKFKKVSTDFRDISYLCRVMTYKSIQYNNEQYKNETNKNAFSKAKDQDKSLKNKWREKVCIV